MNRGRPFPDFRMDAAGRTRNDTLNVSFSSPFFAFCLFFVFLSYSSFSSSSSSSSSFYLKSFESESNNSNNNNSNNNSSSSNKCRDAFDFSEATELEFAVDGDLRPVPLVRNGRLMFRLISMKRAIKSPAGNQIAGGHGGPASLARAQVARRSNGGIGPSLARISEEDSTVPTG